VTTVPGLDEPAVERAELVVRLLADHQPVDSALQGGEADQGRRLASRSWTGDQPDGCHEVKSVKSAGKGCRAPELL